jgi:8-amino-7-oxononanoate synthase
VTLTAAHSEAQVQLLLNALEECFRLSGATEPDHA